MAWTFVAETQYAIIYVDYRQRRTKIQTPKYTYYHQGIYPAQNPDPTKRIRNT